MFFSILLTYNPQGDILWPKTSNNCDFLKPSFWHGCEKMLFLYITLLYIVMLLYKSITIYSMRIWLILKVKSHRAHSEGLTIFWNSSKMEFIIKYQNFIYEIITTTKRGRGSKNKKTFIHIDYLLKKIQRWDASNRLLLCDILVLYFHIYLNYKRRNTVRI